MTQETLQSAVRHHLAGRLAEAETLYRQILIEQPGQADAVHLLGLIAYQSGRMDEAVELIERAIQAEPARADFYGNLGMVLAQRGQPAPAAIALNRALELRPDYPQALSNLAAVLRIGNQLDAAVTVYRRWVSLRPKDAEAWNELGNTLKEDGQFAQAVIAHRQAVEVRPDWLQARQDLVLALVVAGQIDDAIAATREIRSLGSESAPFYTILAGCLSAVGEFAEAEAACRKAVALAPADASSHHRLGLALYNLGRFEESAAEYRHALNLNPALAEVHNDLGELQLLLGDFEHGWDEYEWRRKVSGRRPSPWFHKEQWDGTPLQGRRILLHPEGGFGDTLHLVRYCALVKGGRVILHCPPELLRLLRGLEGVDELIGPEQPEPEHDVQCSLLSLPMVLKTTLQTIPAAVPYLKPDPLLSLRWRRRLLAASAIRKNLNVGLIWSGSPAFPKDAGRSVSLEQLRPLASVSNVQFFSLQKGRRARQARRPPTGWRLIDWTGELGDWIDTASLVANLDLIISVDTAVAHLAGALGKAVWVLLPFVPDWRWLLDREDSPWYPTMRLFRQERRGDWSRPIERMAQELAALAGQ